MNLTPRETRFLNYLLIRPHTRDELGSLVGSLNIPDVKLRIISKGIDIVCKRKPMKDRDGRTVRPGTYYLPEYERERVRKLLEAAATTSSDVKSELAKPTINGGDYTTITA